jgi:hypothetical protein
MHARPAEWVSVRPFGINELETQKLVEANRLLDIRYVQHWRRISRFHGLSF